MSDQASVLAYQRSFLADFDKQVVELANLFRREPDSPTIPVLAAGILDGQRGKLISWDHPESGCGWRDAYPALDGVAVGRIYELRCLDPRQKKALHKLLGAIAGVGCGTDALPTELASEKKERLNKLRVALRDYGPLRGLPIAEEAAGRSRAGAGLGEGDEPKLNSRKENILEELLKKKAFDRESLVPRRTIVASINRLHKSSSYKRAFNELRAAAYIQGEIGADGGTWLTPAGRKRAEELSRRNAATDK